MTEIDEAELLGAARAGTELDGSADGGRRPVSADLLRRCCIALRDQIDPRGIRLTGAHVTGQLDLTGLDVRFPLRFDDCEFEHAPVLLGADLFGLSLTRCRLPGLLANGLRLRNDLDLSGARIRGSHASVASITRRAAVWLSEATVGGRLLCTDAFIDGIQDRALYADRIQIAGAARLIGHFTAFGEVRMMGARIGGGLELTGAHLISRQWLALDLAGATIEGGLLMARDPSGRTPVIRGRVDLASARIKGTITMQNAAVFLAGDPLPYDSAYRWSPPGTVIRAPSLTLGGQFAIERDCRIYGGIDIWMSDVGSIWLGPHISIAAPGSTALEFTSVQVRGSVTLLQQTFVQGTIRMEGALVHGMLGLHGQLSHPEHKSLVAGNGVTVERSVVLEDLVASGGRINFTGATLGSLTAEQAKLCNPDGESLSLGGANVRGSVRLVSGFISAGTVILNRARIGGRLLLSGGSFVCRGPGSGQYPGCAIESISATIDGGIDLGWSEISEAVDVTDTKTSFLADDPDRWPPRYAISGLSYSRFELPQGAAPRAVWDERARSRWLDGQQAFDSGPYEQAARVFREHGYVRGSERILIAQRRQARQVEPVGPSAVKRGRQVLDRAYGFVGYGYRPWQVLWMIGGLLAAVAVTLTVPALQATMRANNGNGSVYSTSGLVLGPSGPAGPRLAAADTCGSGEVRCLSPVLYSVDTVIPLISLDQRSTWYPDPRVRYGEFMLWWLDTATILGWLLSTVFVLSLARLARSQ
jgi:uncharacterized protein YjbI with pentapeptide repeats